MDGLQSPKWTKLTVKYFQILATIEVINLFKFHICLNLFFFKMLFNILTFHSYVAGVYFWLFMIILAEMYIDVYVTKVSIFGQNCSRTTVH